jgi:hypothetical protein
VSRAIHFIWLRFNGRPDPEDSGWNILHLAPDEYAELWDILKETDCGRWAEDKLHYDYDPAWQELILRMPTNTHDHFVWGLTQEIWDQLKVLRARDEVQNTMGSLEPRMVGFNLPGMNEKYPDGAFGSEEIKYPRLVIEVANSQSPKPLKDLAYTYIQASRYRIRTVLTVDLEYLPPRKRSQGHKCSNAVYSIYRLCIETGPDGRRIKRVKADVENRPFRYDGNTPDGDLMLKLSDFLGTSHIEQVINPAISISHSHLTAILAKAEKLQAIHDAPLSPCCSLDEELDNLPDLTSDRSSQSENELTTEDEMAFQQQEETAEQMADESDASYQPIAGRPCKKRRRG